MAAHATTVAAGRQGHVTLQRGLLDVWRTATQRKHTTNSRHQKDNCPANGVDAVPVVKSIASLNLKERNPLLLL